MSGCYKLRVWGRDRDLLRCFGTSIFQTYRNESSFFDHMQSNSHSL